MTEDRRWRKDIPEALLKARLLNGPEMDAHLHKALQISRSSTPLIEFIVHLVSPFSPLRDHQHIKEYPS